mgnify:CR=1 FL=1
MKLKHFLENNKLARKIFGKRKIIIIKKQLEGINLTQSEKNRLSRDIRPKFKFIKQASRFSDEFDLKKGAENKRLVEEAVEEIKKTRFFPRIREIWLFGSMLRKEMSVRSDIDIAVLFGKINKKEAANFRVKVLANLPEKIDIQVFNVLPEKIKKSILKNHKTLYKKNGK